MDRVRQVRAALLASASTQLAEHFFEAFDQNLDPNLNATPSGPTCARQALRAVLRARAGLGLSTGALAMDYGTGLALVDHGLGVMANNGIQVGGLQGTTDYGMPISGTNIKGAGGGWIAALPSRPAHGVDRDIHEARNEPTGPGEIPSQFRAKGSTCFEPSSKRWGITAHDPGCVTFAEVDQCCGCC